MLEDWTNIVEVERDLGDAGKVGLIESGESLDEWERSSLSIQDSYQRHAHVNASRYHRATCDSSALCLAAELASTLCTPGKVRSGEGFQLTLM